MTKFEGPEVYIRKVGFMCFALHSSFIKLSRKYFCFVLAGPADGTEDEAKIILEPQPDAVLRLGQFIGDKLYLRDFLSL